MQRCLNGANLVVRKSSSQILIVRANYGEKRLLLPGGGVELDETPEQAAVRELHEETGLIAHVMDLRLVAKLVQRVPTDNGLQDGCLHLFETRKVTGEKFTTPTCEILDSGYMEIGEIVSRQSEFGLGYRRMIYQYLRCVSGLSPVPFAGRLRDEVECPEWATRRSGVLSL